MALTGKTFTDLAGKLDDERKNLFRHHGSAPNGRFSFTETLVEEVMLKLAGLPVTNEDKSNEQPYRNRF